MTEEIVTANEVEFMKFVALIEKAMKDIQPIIIGLKELH